MERKLRLALLASAVMVPVWAAYAGMTRYFVELALDRKMPPVPLGFRGRLSGQMPDENTLRRLAQAADALRGRAHRQVLLTARDGTVLVGHWFVPEHPKRVVLAMHGWRSDWAENFGLIAPFWLENGCAVLLPEQRGQGQSGGNAMAFGLLERFDCLDWLQWLNSQGCDCLPIYLGGVSMGASTVLMAAGEELPDNVRGVVADCGYSTIGGIWRHVARRNLHITYAPRRRRVSKLCIHRLHCAPEDWSCPQALARSRVPVLLIHGSGDRFVPVEMSYENFLACPGERQIWIVPGAGHGMSFLTDPEGYKNRLRDFWRQCEVDNGSAGG